MNILRAIWEAILAFINSWRQSQAEEAVEAQAAQNEIARGTQEAIDQVEGKSDEELLDSAIDLGLVSGVQSQGADRAKGLQPGACDRRFYQSPYDRAFGKAKE